MLSDEEKNIIDKLESIKVNVEGKLYNYEASRILHLINRLQKENEELQKSYSTKSKNGMLLENIDTVTMYSRGDN